MPKDESRIPLDVFPEKLQSAISKIALNARLSDEEKQEQIHSVIFGALENPEVREQVRKTLLLKYPEIARRIRPDEDLKSEEKHALPPGGEIFVLFALLRYPITWVILGIGLLLYLASHANC